MLINVASVLMSNGSYIPSLVVLPSYLSWIVLLLFCNGMANLNKPILYPVSLIVTLSSFFVFITYFFLQNEVSNGLFFKSLGPNNFSSLMIASTPIAIQAIRRLKGLALALPYFIIVLIGQLIENRRAGFGIILITGLLTLNSSIIGRLNKTTLIRLALVLSSCILLTFLPLTNTLLSGSPRLHQLIYNTSSIEEDRSLLVRFAMISKGLSLFSQNPLTGIGINNFTTTYKKPELSFKNSYYVEHRRIYETISSHNSYILLLSEGGLVLAVPFFLILLNIIAVYLNNLRYLDHLMTAWMLSLLGTLVHMFFINSILNSYLWFYLGMSIYITRTISKKRVSP